MTLRSSYQRTPLPSPVYCIVHIQETNQLNNRSCPKVSSLVSTSAANTYNKLSSGLHPSAALCTKRSRARYIFRFFLNTALDRTSADPREYSNLIAVCVLRASEQEEGQYRLFLLGLA